MTVAEKRMLEDQYLPALQAMASSLGFSLAVTNLEHYIFYMRSRHIDLKIHPGDPIPENTAIRKTLSSGTVQTLRGDASTFGVSYRVKTFPLRDKRGSIIGGCAVLEATDTEDSLQKLSEDLSQAMTQLTEASDEMMTQVEEMKMRSNRLLKDMESTRETIAQSSSIMDFVHMVSRQSDILSLNAVVEAARVGGTSNTFHVVAKEMRSLAHETKSSVEEIHRILMEIQKDSQHTSQEMEQFHTLVSHISQQIDGIFKTLHKVSDAAVSLKNMSSSLMQ